MAKVYNAPKPTYSTWEWFKSIALRIVFPPVLVWDLFKLGANKLFGRFISQLVLPAQNSSFDHLAVTDELLELYNTQDLICEKHEVITYDGAHLDTFEVKHNDQNNLAPEHQKYIVNFVGNGMCYEHIIRDMKSDAAALKANVVGFNLRGVGKSTSSPQSKDDLVTDGIAQVQRLLDQGVSPQNITLKGHSLGASIATLVAQHFHQQGQPVNLFNSRSFSSITNFLVGNIRLARDEDGAALGQKESAGKIILGWLLKPFIKLGVALVNWEINAGSAYKSIPDAYKDYIVVRSRKEIRNERYDDMVIPHYASIHKDLTSERRAKKATIDREIANLDHMMQDADPLTKPGLANARDALVQARHQLKSDRKMEDENPLGNGHNSHWSSLNNRSNKSSQTFFNEFVTRVEQDHAITEVEAEALRVN